MSKPEYYKLPSGVYVALNRSAKRMFKKQGIEYRTENQFIDFKSMVDRQLKEKGLTDGNEKKKVK